jgi:organic hydroperoxide reductase OsmC/OhrA
VSTAYRVRTRTVGGGPTALGEGVPFTLIIDRPESAGGGGLGFNGGQLLHLSIAACLSNDLYVVRDRRYRRYRWSDGRRSGPTADVARQSQRNRGGDRPEA